ncbi:MAG: hypothetical protein J5932_11185 [Prevotella sp.]|nr:hypothetical protein [Prevotella sp.]MBP3775952.1 hypothetical protein [Prevotella sp.]
MSWIEKEEAKIPSYSRQELESLYRGVMKINSIYEKKEDELFERISILKRDIQVLELQLRNLGITPHTEKEQCKVIQMIAR